MSSMAQSTLLLNITSIELHSRLAIIKNTYEYGANILIDKQLSKPFVRIFFISTKYLFIDCIKK